MHWQQPNLLALSETDGHGDTCGLIVILDYVTQAIGLPLTILQLDTLRTKYLANGMFGPNGMTMRQIKEVLNDMGIHEVKFVDYQANLNFGAFRQDMIDAISKGQAVIWETANAQALPDNQPGVQYHFILSWGIDSNLGYLSCNGDSETALHHGGVVEPVWYNIGAIQAARPVGYIILPEVKELITLETDANGNLGGAHDDTTHQHVGTGIAAAIANANLLENDLTLGETYGPTADISCAVVSHRYLVTWQKQVGSHLVDWSEAAQLIEHFVNLAENPVVVHDSDDAVNKLVVELNQDLATAATNFAEVQKTLSSLTAAQQLDR